MGRTPASPSKTPQTFSFEVVAVLLTKVRETGIGMSSLYERMAAVDGQRTASSFEHQFRAVMKRAEELRRLNGGEQGLSPKKGPTKRRLADGPDNVKARAKKRVAVAEGESA